MASSNLLIDASGIFYRSLFTVGNFGASSKTKLLGTPQSQGVFIRKLAGDFASLVKSIEGVGRVIVCVDSTSWRKEVHIEENDGYKSNRDKDPDDNNVDWQAFFDLTAEFIEILGKRGYIISKIHRAEADDLLFLWSRKLNALGENVIDATGDKDMLQTVILNDNGTWTVVLDPVNSRRKVSLTQETLDSKPGDEEEEVDIFKPETWSTNSYDLLQKLLSTNDMQIVNPSDLILKKIILGDGGDAVPGVVTWTEPDKKDPAKLVLRSMSAGKLEKVLMLAPGLTWRGINDGVGVDRLTDAINTVMKAKLKQPLTAEEVLKKIRRNTTLVVLDESTIPDTIQKAFAQTFQVVPDTQVHIPREGLLEGTKWWSKKETFIPKSFDLF